MPAFIFIGWVTGVVIAILLAIVALLFAGIAVPALLSPASAIVGAIIAPIPPILIAILWPLVFVAVYLAGYRIATLAIAPSLPPLVAGAISFPATHQFGPAGGTAKTVPAANGEYFGRGLLIGLTAAFNAVALSVIPIAGVMLGGWAFWMISLGALPAFARNRFYQGFLGWAAWLFPVSHIATAVGLLLFLVTIPLTFAELGPGGFRIDWTTGVIQSAGGLVSLLKDGSGNPYDGGFSLGNFTFVSSNLASGPFTAPSINSHETGHTLNTALLGGIVLWINAVDENFWPGRANLAYGELCAEGHSRAMPGSPDPDLSTRLWY